MDQAQSNRLLSEWQQTAPHWAKYRDTIREMFTPLTKALIEAAEIRPGQSVLDVAGGAGEPSLTIAETVGPAGSVMFTDAVAEMVEAARAEAAARNIANVEFHQCTADHLPFADSSFDVAVSRLGIMLFSDPSAAVREMLRVIKPGGRLAFVVWGKNELNPFTHIITDVMARHVASPPAEPDAPGAFRFAEPGNLAKVLSDAGAGDVEDRVFKFEIAAPIPPEQFWQMRSRISDSVRTKLSQLSQALQAQIAGEVIAAVKEFFPHNQMRFPSQMLIVTGMKSE